MIPVLVTGFGPFGDNTDNPSALLAHAVRDEPGVVGAVLPVTWDGAVAGFADLVERHRPAAALAFGLAAGIDRIRVERVALNLDDSEAPDNGGEVRRGRRIAEDGPVGHWAGLPVDAMVDALRAAGLPAGPSAHAGAYVCNHLFFSARHRWPGLPMTFIHLPPLGAAETTPEGLRLAARVLIGVARAAVAG